MNEIETRGQVAPLVGTAELEHAVVMIVQVQIVVALQHLVAEFSEGDALFGIQATGDDVLRDHRSHAEVLADVTQEVQYVHRGGPIVVRDEGDGIGALLFKDAANLDAQTLTPLFHYVLGVEDAFAGLTRIADQTCGTTHQCDRMMTGFLKVAHDDELDEVADVQRGGGRIEAAIIGDGLSVQRFGESIPVSGLGNQPAPFQFIEDGIETGLLEIDDVSHTYSPRVL